MKRLLQISCFSVLLILLLASFVKAGESPGAKQKLPDEARIILLKPDSFTLFSLDPDWTDDQTKAALFQNRRILGKIQITKTQPQTNLIAVLERGIARADSWARCFSPRHGIRASNGTNSVDLLICFECGHVHTFLSRGTNTTFTALATTREPEPVFNDVLKAAGIPVTNK